jgi:hypothetical protein
MTRNRQSGVINKMASTRATCHPNRPAQARGLCKSCYDAWLKQNNPGYAQRQRENCLNWSRNHAELNRARSKSWRVKQDPSYGRIRSLRRFGMTLDDYAQRLTDQGGVCAICKQPPKPGKNLAVDHCHKTGEIRGLLCFRCNFGLSYFSESATRLAVAGAYVMGALAPPAEEIVLAHESCISCTCDKCLDARASLV